MAGEDEGSIRVIGGLCDPVTDAGGPLGVRVGHVIDWTEGHTLTINPVMGIVHGLGPELDTLFVCKWVGRSPSKVRRSDTDDNTVVAFEGTFDNLHVADVHGLKAPNKNCIIHCANSIAT